MNRLVIDVSSEQHQQIKAPAALNGQSIKDFVMNKVLSQNDMEDLHQLLLSRIHDAKGSELPKQSFSKLTEYLIKPRKNN
jgi:uncharacterized protein (DUF1778 family)